MNAIGHIHTPTDHSQHIGHAQHQSSGNTSRPHVNATETQMLRYMDQLAEQHQVDPKAIRALYESNQMHGNYNQSLPANDSTRGLLQGPLRVHNELAIDGQWKMLDSTKNELKDWRVSLESGVDHFANLLQKAGGDYTKAVNAFKTGNPNNNQHNMQGWSLGDSRQNDSSNRAHHAHAQGGSPSTVQSRISRAGDEFIQPETQHASGHIGGPESGHGMLQNKRLTLETLEKFTGRDGEQVIRDFVKAGEANGAYNRGQTEAQKTKGAFLMANTAVKLEMLPAQQFNNSTEAGMAWGRAKNLALAGDAQGLRQHIANEGGNTRGLNDAQLINAWGTNEHNNLHNITFGNSAVYNPIHMTSLNNNDAHVHDGMNRGQMGGYNDKGDYPQWGFFDDAKNYNRMFSSALGK